MSCKNTIEQVVPKGWDYTTITQSCGATSIHGHAQYCEDCQKKHRKQGHRPNECPHGHNVYEGTCQHEDCN